MGLQNWLVVLPGWKGVPRTRAGVWEPPDSLNTCHTQRPAYGELGGEEEGGDGDLVHGDVREPDVVLRVDEEAVGHVELVLTALQVRTTSE